MNTTNKQLICDADMIVFRAAAAAEQEIRWDDDTWTLQTNMSDAKSIVLQQMDAIMHDLNTTNVVMVFSPSKNYRHDLCPTYKANRKDKRKPLGLKELRDWVTDTYPTTCAPNIEADDLIGILVTEAPEHRIAVSGDKDFGTLPVTWYNPLKKSINTATEEDADRFHLIQSLMGDTADGYAGLKGVGPKTAEKILDKGGATWETVVAAYESKGLTEEEALLTARLARILRAGDYDHKTKEVTLWEPTKH
jgi:DNA polymerase-1